MRPVGRSDCVLNEAVQRVWRRSCLFLSSALFDLANQHLLEQYLEQKTHFPTHAKSLLLFPFIFWLGYCSHKSPLKCVALSEPIVMPSALTVTWFSYNRDLGYCLNSSYVVLTMSRLLPSSTHNPLLNLLPGCAKHSCVYLDSPRVRKTNSCLPGISVNKKCCKKHYILSL